MYRMQYGGRNVCIIIIIIIIKSSAIMVFKIHKTM